MVANHSVADENHPVIEVLSEITLNTPVEEIMVLNEIIVDFKNLTDNDFDFFETLAFQGWNTFFERLTGPTYPVLVKQLWIHAAAGKDIITSYIMHMKIVIMEKYIAYIISHNGCGKGCITPNIDAIVTSIIFKKGTKVDEGKGISSKYLNDNLRVWFKIILDYIHHRPNTNSYDYINTTQNFMLFFLEKGFKLALLAILFKFLRDSIRETRTGSSSKRGRFISNGRLIYNL